MWIYYDGEIKKNTKSTWIECSQVVVHHWDTSSVMDVIWSTNFAFLRQFAFTSWYHFGNLQTSRITDKYHWCIAICLLCGWYITWNYPCTVKYNIILSWISIVANNLHWIYHRTVTPRGLDDIKLTELHTFQSSNIIINTSCCHQELISTCTANKTHFCP